MIINPFLRSQGAASSFQLAQSVGGSLEVDIGTSAKPILDSRLWAEVAQLSYISEVCTVTNIDPQVKQRAHIPVPANASRLCVLGRKPEEVSVFLSRGAAAAVSGFAAEQMSRRTKVEEPSPSRLPSRIARGSCVINART